jgi:hypothetical protein
MNSLSRTGFGPTRMIAPASRRTTGVPAIPTLGRAETELAAKLTEALIAADAIGLTGIGLRLDQALVELTGIGLPIRGVGDDQPAH